MWKDKSGPACTLAGDQGSVSRGQRMLGLSSTAQRQEKKRDGSQTTRAVQASKQASTLSSPSIHPFLRLYATPATHTRHHKAASDKHVSNLVRQGERSQHVSQKSGTCLGVGAPARKPDPPAGSTAATLIFASSAHCSGESAFSSSLLQLAILKDRGGLSAHDSEGNCHRKSVALQAAAWRHAPPLAARTCGIDGILASY